MDSKLAKNAALAIESLKEQLQKTEAALSDKDCELTLYKRAQELAFTMFKKGSLAAEDLETTIKIYSTKDPGEIAVLEKVAEFNIGHTFNIGRVSDRETSEGLDPITNWILNDED